MEEELPSVSQGEQGKALSPPPLQPQMCCTFPLQPRAALALESSGHGLHDVPSSRTRLRNNLLQEDLTASPENSRYKGRQQQEDTSEEHASGSEWPSKAQRGTLQQL